MRQNKKNHVIDFLFPVVLLLVFMLAALTVIMLATNIYRSTTRESALTYTAQTSLAYVTEKIHQYDENGAIGTGEVEGVQCLILSRVHNDSLYKTYIYSYDGHLMELFAKDGANCSLSDGTELLEVSDFAISRVAPNCISFSCTDADGQSSSTIVTLRSSAES